ncbi:10317_t:CDS:10 [Funneliformis geosporum]|nr:10317_t:CDS:10 [Funneliformis geosporum]
MKVNINSPLKEAKNSKVEIRHEKDIKKYGKVIRREYKLVEGKIVQFNNKYSFYVMPEPSNRVKEMKTEELKKNLGDIEKICSNEDEKIAEAVIKDNKKRLAVYKEIFNEVSEVFNENKSAELQQEIKVLISSSDYYLGEIKNYVKQLKSFNRKLTKNIKKKDLVELKYVVKELDSIFAFESSQETIPNILEELKLMELVYKRGFENGIGFCNEILGKFGDDIEELKERGHLRFRKIFKSDMLRINDNFSPFRDLENISQWLEQENKIDCKEWELLGEVRSGLVNLRSLLYGLDHKHNFKDEKVRKSIDGFYQWLDKESRRCGSCDVSDNKVELAKCQSCRYYFCPPCKVFNKLNSFDKLSSRQIINLENKMFSMLDWDKLKCKALADLADFNGKTCETKLNQREVKSAKVLHDEKELKTSMRDFLAHNFAEKIKWLENEMVKEIQAFILLELTEKAHEKRNSEAEFKKIDEVADYLASEAELKRQRKELQRQGFYNYQNPIECLKCSVMIKVKLEWGGSDKGSRDEIVNYIHCEYINEDDLINEALGLLNPLEKSLTDKENLRKHLSGFNDNNVGKKDLDYKKVISDLKSCLVQKIIKEAKSITAKIMEVKFRGINDKELLSEIETRFKKGKINRRELLRLARVDYCLECQGNSEVEENGYCENFNLVNRLENTGDILDKINFKIKAYDDFIGASLKLRSKLLETDKEKQEVRVKLGEVYKKGF